MIIVEKADLLPIMIEEGKNGVFFSALQNHQKKEEIFLEAAKKVFCIMRRKGLIQSPEQRAIWIQQEFRTHESYGIIKKIGDSFPNKILEDRYKKSLKKGLTMMNKDNDSICSHEIRSPNESIYGGIIKLNFMLASSSCKVSYLNCTTGAIGLREWENLALVIGIFGYLGIAGLKDQQIQEILFRADQAVKKEPQYKPRFASIARFTKTLFDVIG